MVNVVFSFTLGIGLAVLLAWGFKVLPAERWQILACIPQKKLENGTWKGLNLTYYGFFNALAYLFSVAVLLCLMASIAVPLSVVLVMTIAVFALCVPASKCIARWVEKKPHTFTVGGASFVGIITVPWIVLGIDRVISPWYETNLEVIPTLAAVSIAYALGEGIGRLACISFGCCYGKPVSESPLWLRRIFEKYYFVFQGKTKKISYANSLEGVKVVPIQAMTSILYVCVGVVGIYLFLEEHFMISFLLTLITTQVWRILSEFLRADYRGENNISAYQIMAGVAVCYSAALLFVLPPSDMHAPDVLAGLRAMWSPAVIICLRVLWLATFIYTGISDVTGSDVNLRVVRDRT
ncbi:MAG: prolipoprotein diacylglyceryl transferase [Deltaproteobacteria bacterium]|nr:prolipoprotein diacylglyceryl transferase [Deltaproteobacteria bacterium]MBN2688215.1 prolipoprotein diacylglyceryl transferase [Deltaproteobacteria bacterium]